jgi:signal transduction histidine kinase
LGLSAELTTRRGAPTSRAREFVERSTWKALVQFLPHAVLLLDESLRVRIANRAASLLFNLPAAQLTGLPISSVLPQPHLDEWLDDFGGQRTKVIETSMTAAASQAPRRTLQIIAVSLARARSKYRLLVLEDITNRAALEEMLVQSEKQAAMGQLAAGLLHEIANPLAGLGSNLLFARSALHETAHPDVRQALDMSLDQLDQMRQLLGTLSGFPRRTAPAFETANLVDLLRRSVAFINRDARQRRIRIEMSFASPRIACEMDVRLIRQVLLNVLKNAMEAMPDGGRIDVRARTCAREDAPAATAIVEVTDTGVGIAEPDLRKVFRPLFSTKPRGAGLGLSFCRQAIEDHGGHIRLASRGVNLGTLVTITLPLRQSSVDEES